MLWAPESLATPAGQQPKLAPIIAAFEEMIPVTRTQIGEERLCWLRTLPERHSAGSLTVVHASPGDLWRAPLDKAQDSELQNTYGRLGSQIVIYGYIHRPYVRQLEGLTVANAGSVSLSYDGDPRASYLVLDGDNISLRRVEYDRESECADLLGSGLPPAEWLCRILRKGRYCPP
jgi:diadenosine tetraphosphatase ApaH/serine/threonine PP2A family protein phosphatase